MTLDIGAFSKLLMFLHTNSSAKLVQSWVTVIVDEENNLSEAALEPQTASGFIQTATFNFGFIFQFFHFSSSKFY